MFKIGTSGFSYQDWVDQFYPKGMTKKEMLGYYSSHFDCVEINSTYYKIPHPAVMFQMGKKVGDNFEFVVKANRQMTHEIKNIGQIFQDFKECLKPLQEVDKLGAVLAQFPWSFKKNSANIKYLRKLREIMENIPMVIEFRNIEWFDREVFDFLQENNLGFCNVDQPRLKGLLPNTNVNTTAIGYYRFHGRNEEKWWSKGKEPWERYDYLYQEKELAELLPFVKEVIKNSRKTFLFFNNHYRGQAVKNAKMMKALLLVPEE